jgi:organic radical activating enzyme
MKKIIQVIQPDDAPMHLTWIINNICTNACSYCPENLHNGTNHNYDWENAREFFKLLFNKYSNIHCSVAGGEPSVSPFFKEIVKTFHDKGHTIGITSNAAKPVDFWSDVSQYLTYICFSYHSEFPDPKFIEKVTAAGMNCPVTVRVMMLPSNWDHCLEIYDKLYNNRYVRVEPVRIQNWSGRNTEAHKYTDKQLEWFIKESSGSTTKSLSHIKRNIKTANISADFKFNDGSIEYATNAVEYINSGLTNFNGYQCEVGLKSLFIDHEGYILLGNCGIDGPIGNINDPNNVKWPEGPVLCSKNLCHCTTDVNINKILK